MDDKSEVKEAEPSPKSSTSSTKKRTIDEISGGVAEEDKPSSKKLKVDEDQVGVAEGEGTNSKSETEEMVVEVTSQIESLKVEEPTSPVKAAVEAVAPTEEQQPVEQQEALVPDAEPAKETVVAEVPVEETPAAEKEEVPAETSPEQEAPSVEEPEVAATTEEPAAENKEESEPI